MPGERVLPSRAQIQRRGARRQQHTAGVTVGSQSHSDGTDSVTELVREMNACGRAPSTIHLSHTTEIIHPSRPSGRRARTRAASRGARGPERSGGARGQAQARPPGARMRPGRGGERTSFLFTSYPPYIFGVFIAVSSPTGGVAPRSTQSRPLAPKATSDRWKKRRGRGLALAWR